MLILKTILGNNDSLHVVIDSLPTGDIPWYDLLSSFLTPTIAIITTYIAIQQYKVNKQRLRHELYTKRLAIYKCLQSHLRSIISKANTSLEQNSFFTNETAEALFLFGRTVQQNVEEINKKSIDLYVLGVKLEVTDLSKEKRDELVQQKKKLLLWFSDQVDVSKKVFAGEMSFLK
ncbi:hypothetical protein [Gimesia maris]|uniref:hypothetical protein n=1 Tax=Gimesia maris TaxID=122 RepID=UPI003A8F2E58